MKKIFLMTHIGLGDAIIQNGLIRELALQNDKIYLPCYWHNVPSITCMLSDLPNITLCQIINDKDIYGLERLFQNKETHEVLRLGMYSGEAHVAPETFDQTFYRQAGIHFTKRWDAFKLNECYQCPIPSGEYSLICDSPSRGFNIDRSKASFPIVELDFSNERTIFAYCDLMRNATELHCINSAPAILADSIPIKGKGFFHRYARPYTSYDNFKLRKNWKVFD